MKNNRLTNSELSALRNIANDIRHLVSMETCSFKDDEFVLIDMLRLWLMWFKVNADKISAIVGDNE